MVTLALPRKSLFPSKTTEMKDFQVEIPLLPAVDSCAEGWEVNLMYWMEAESNPSRKIGLKMPEEG